MENPWIRRSKIEKGMHTCLHPHRRTRKYALQDCFRGSYSSRILSLGSNSEFSYAKTQVNTCMHIYSPPKFQNTNPFENRLDGCQVIPLWRNPWIRRSKIEKGVHVCMYPRRSKRIQPQVFRVHTAYNFSFAPILLKIGLRNLLVVRNNFYADHHHMSRQMRLTRANPGNPRFHQPKLSMGIDVGETL